MSGFGTQFSIRIGMNPIDGNHMADVDFKARFYVKERTFVEIDKVAIIF